MSKIRWNMKNTCKKLRVHQKGNEHGHGDRAKP